MDDYILEILRRQGQPEMTDTQGLQLEQEILPGINSIGMQTGNKASEAAAEGRPAGQPEEAHVQTKVEGSQTDRQTEPETEQAYSQGAAEDRTRRSDNLNRVLQEMEPVQLAVGVAAGETASWRKTETEPTEQAWYTAALPAAMSYGAAAYSGQGEVRGTSPEELSMFFQRDARRYP